MKKFAFAFALAIASLGAARAQTWVPVADAASKPLRYVAGAGLTYGGQKILTAYFTNGDRVDIDGGGSVTLYAGLDYRAGPQFSVQGTVGYHVDSAAGMNGDVRFERVPVELLGYFHVNDKVRAGAGLRHVTGVGLRAGGVGQEQVGDHEFEDTTGALAEIEYLYSPQLGFKLRFVNDKFKEKTDGATIRGNHVGALVNFYF